MVNYDYFIDIKVQKMSRSEQQKQQNIICVEYEWYNNDYKESTTVQSPIDQQHQPELPVSCKTWKYTPTAYDISNEFVVIKIDGIDTLVKINYPRRSKPLHVHIVEHLCSVYDYYGYESDQLSGHTIFVIFTDHILRIRLNIDLDDEKFCSLFEECKTDFSFSISRIESSLFRIIEDERNERLKASLVLDETCWKKVELFEICLFPDGEGIFSKMREIFFRLPPNITEIEINHNSNCIYLSLTNKFLIFIFDGESDALDDYYSPIFLLNDFKRCILAESHQLRRFQSIEFQIVATMYVRSFKDHADLPEIREFIKAFLELNKYIRNHEEDSDCGSDSGPDSD